MPAHPGRTASPRTTRKDCAIDKNVDRRLSLPGADAVAPSEAAHGSPPRRAKRAIPWKRRVFYLACPFVLFFVVLAGIEAFVRLTTPHVPSLQSFVEVVFPAIHTDNERDHVFRGDPYLSWALRPNMDHAHWSYTTFSTNSRGIRYPGPLGRKPRDTFRIVCLGDSITFGYRVPATSPDTPMVFDPDHLPYARLIEDRLRVANPGRRIEVVPLAAAGYTSHQGLIWLRRDIGWLKPDVVVICFAYNDTQLRPQPDSKTIPTTRLRIAQRWLMMRSQAVIYFARWRAARSEQEASPTTTQSRPPTPRVSEDEYLANILEITRIAREHGSRVVVVAPIYRDRILYSEQVARLQSYHAALAAAARDADVPFLDIEELSMNRDPTNAPLFGESIHPNELGHRLMANVLLDFFARERMLGDLSIGP